MSTQELCNLGQVMYILQFIHIIYVYEMGFIILVLIFHKIVEKIKYRK